MRTPKNTAIVKVLAGYLAVAFLVTGIVEKSYAGFTPSEAVNLSLHKGSENLVKIRTLLETKVIGERLIQHCDSFCASYVSAETGLMRMDQERNA